MSAIADFTVDFPRVGIVSMARSRIPDRVVAGMWLAAWARAEHCDVEICDGRLDLRARYCPSPELERAFAAGRAHVVGVLGWGVPLMFDDRRRPFAASWGYGIYRWGRS